MGCQIQFLDKATTIAHQGELLALAERVFDQIEPEYIHWRIQNMPDVTTFVATENGQWVGFKSGYAMTTRRYYSWLGGVDTDHRQSGFAGQLMQAQHNWLTDTVYDTVETHVRQDNKAMVKTNQKYGFKVAGRFKKSGDVYLILQRPISKV